MKNEKDMTEAGQQYSTAHTAHYETRDLPDALELYRGILAAHPEAREAGYSRSQIQNIVTRVVPEEELLDTGVDMALACFEREKSNAPEAGSGRAARVVGFQVAHAARSRPVRSEPPSLTRPQTGRMRARQVSSTPEEGD